MALALIPLGAPVYAADGEDEEPSGPFQIEGDTLVAYPGGSSFVRVPDTVSIIGSGAFEEAPNVATIVLPDTVRELQDEAFSGSENRSWQGERGQRRQRPFS